MDLTWVLLDIPQGAVTIGSAILVVLVGALLTLGIWIFRLLYSIQGRLTALETKLAQLDLAEMADSSARINLMWEEFKIEGVANLRRGAGPPGNPMLQERWDELLLKLERDELADDEAEELLAALLKRREQAKDEDDVVTNMLLGPGIVLTKWQLKEKELREQSAKTDARNR